MTGPNANLDRQGQFAGVSSAIRDRGLQETYKQQHWMGTFWDYLDRVVNSPQIAYSAHQRMHSMIVSHGVETYEAGGTKHQHYKFFDDPFTGGREAIFGLDDQLGKLVHLLEGAARGYGTEKRLILLLGPVGSSKSTIASLLKRGLEAYSKSEAGAVYTLGFTEEPHNGEQLTERFDRNKVTFSPMNSNPLCLLPPELMTGILDDLNRQANEVRKKQGLEPLPYRIGMAGGLDPAMAYERDQLLARYDGNWEEVLKHVVIKRVILSEEQRVGITTFQPKDEKDQDAAELTGDVNYRKLAQFGSDSDPRAFSFDGELCLANRGMIELVEVLKLGTAFLYDLLGATQEQRIKAKKFSQIPIDTVIIGHTNEPEYEKLRKNVHMEAFKDRTIVVDVPYITATTPEEKIYKKNFTTEKVGVHVAPHTVGVAAMFSVLSRLEEPKNSGISLIQKMKLYDGQFVQGITEQQVKNLKKDAPREGHGGISPRFIQDCLSECLVDIGREGRKYIGPFDIMEKMREKFPTNPHFATPDAQERLKTIMTLVEDEFKEIAKREVQRAIAGDEKALKAIATKYMENVSAYCAKKKLINPLTKQPTEPDEELMKSIEEHMSIPGNIKEEFRRQMLTAVGAMAAEGAVYNPLDDQRLRWGCERKLFEDSKNTFSLRKVLTMEDSEQVEKFDSLVTRLISQFGYTKESAADLLNYVSSYMN
jgi:serine protein kinase